MATIATITTSMRTPPTNSATVESTPKIVLPDDPDDTPGAP
jgi:hypothetical protein